MKPNKNSKFRSKLVVNPSIPYLDQIDALFAYVTQSLNFYNLLAASRGVYLHLMHKKVVFITQSILEILMALEFVIFWICPGEPDHTHLNWINLFLHITYLILECDYQIPFFQ